VFYSFIVIPGVSTLYQILGYDWLTHMSDMEFTWSIGIARFVSQENGVRAIRYRKTEIIGVYLTAIIFALRGITTMDVICTFFFRSYGGVYCNSHDENLTNRLIQVNMLSKIDCYVLRP